MANQIFNDLVFCQLNIWSGSREKFVFNNSYTGGCLWMQRLRRGIITVPRIYSKLVINAFFKNKLLSGASLDIELQQTVNGLTFSF